MSQSDSGESDQRSNNRPVVSMNQTLEFSLQNGLAVQKVFENAQRYGLRPQDEAALIQGRQSMIQYTRWGFFLGATLAPLPLFRGMYAIKNLPKLAPLVDRVTKKPDPELIKARMIWLAKSVVATTVGSGVGTWVGFEFGLLRMNQRVRSVEGCRERLFHAFEEARKELLLSNNQIPIQSRYNQQLRGRSESLEQDGSRERDSSRDFVADQGFYTQQNLDEIDLQHQQNRSDSLERQTSIKSEVDRSNQSNFSGTSGSRWEELRKSRNATPSTWETIRQKQNRPIDPDLQPSSSTSSSNSKDYSVNQNSNTSAPEISQESFEELLERERKLSSGEIRSRS
ncbi:hypothetical protein PPACK8108_LOCUS23804 [Phakopsora pachyrhizi]|uniref:Transmembrane protein n=1 Tax=Phakopsora pachyrhizi TaxID=170000 RepID=A0AAV0BNB5_PHAPC|nr:hypothetical protein PPACK8108_LOCUS23804 [Phakopsora pachyrhizi]